MTERDAHEEIWRELRGLAREQSETRALLGTMMTSVSRIEQRVFDQAERGGVAEGRWWMITKGGAMVISALAVIAAAAKIIIG